MKVILWQVITLIIALVVWAVVMGSILCANRERDKTDKILNAADRNKFDTCIAQFPSHQKIYLVPKDVYTKHHSEWKKNEYPEKYYVGSYPFSIFWYLHR